MSHCPHCHTAHAETYTCNAKHMANIAHNMANVANSMANTYKYRNVERRRAYMREYMKRKRNSSPSSK